MEILLEAEKKETDLKVIVSWEKSVIQLRAEEGVSFLKRARSAWLDLPAVSNPFLFSISSLVDYLVAFIDYYKYARENFKGTKRPTETA